MLICKCAHCCTCAPWCLCTRAVVCAPRWNDAAGPCQVMLSGESASGRYPSETVAMMGKVTVIRVRVTDDGQGSCALNAPLHIPPASAPWAAFLPRSLGRGSLHGYGCMPLCSPIRYAYIPVCLYVCMPLLLCAALNDGSAPVMHPLQASTSPCRSVRRRSSTSGPLGPRPASVLQLLQHTWAMPGAQGSQERPTRSAQGSQERPTRTTKPLAWRQRLQP